MTKEEAHAIFDQWVSNQNLKKHMLAVAQAAGFYARKFQEDEERWWIAGLLHDADYEKYPNPNRDTTGHPYKIVEYLRQKGTDEESLEAILGHASYTNTPRTSLMAKTLFAVDELTGFIVAVALIKPEKSLAAVDVESVTKRFKEKRFAAGVNREEIFEGARDLNIPLEEHVQNVIDAMKEISSELQL